MKYIYSISIFLILFSLSVSASFNNHLRQDTTIQIKKIEFSRNITGPGISFDDLLLNNRFKVIFDLNGSVLLTWPGKCPAKFLGRNIICSYHGNISKKEFYKLSKYLKKIQFLQLEENYTQDTDDVGYHIYEIIYNDNKIKKIIDSNYEIKKIKKLRKKIYKIKNKIKWTPTLIDSN